MTLAAHDIIRRWRESPLAFVREVFKVEPDAWQADVLDAFPHMPRIAMKACKGPGKTTVLAWLAWNFLATRLHPRVAATSITGDNLADNLWPEMSKWQQQSELLTRFFSWTATRIFNKQHRETWWMSARTWPRSGNPQQQADTLAGLHASNLLFIIDESGGVPDAVMAAAEAGLANVVDPAKQEAHIVQAGNPTHLEGPLYRACSSERHLWHVVEITADPDDPKRTPRVSAEWARIQIEKYGRDNPWVLVNVFGRFPPSSINALFGPDEVREAMVRHLRPEQYSHAAKILGVDVARFGDDASTIYRRQGLAVWSPRVLRNLDSLQGAGQVAYDWREFTADACFIDGTGGWGAGWVDNLQALGHAAVSVNFSGEPIDRRFVNKRAEMYWLAMEWMKQGGTLPDVPELLSDLTAHTYYFKGDRIAIEEKDQIKLKLGRSPDHSDGLVLTFAYPVVARAAQLAHSGMSRADYNPLDRM